MIGREMIATRNAIEALRAGVPNRAAIRLLGTSEVVLSQDFLDRLQRCGTALTSSEQVEGLGVAGAFGAGKSHLLGYFAELAQRENFIVSLVPISKETPLFDPARLFTAASRAAVVPGENDDAMTAVLRRLRPNTGRYDDLEYWATSEVQRGRLSPLFPALLHVIPRLRDPDDHARIARFFGGARLNVSAVKGWLRDAGAAKLFDLKPVREAELSLQRLRFAPRLIRAAGFAGLCVLLDEVELIGRYSPLQRGRGYSELARWLGLDQQENIPGMVSVSAITDDFTDEMFIQRRDDELIPSRLEQRGLLPQAELAKKAISWLAQRQNRLIPPTEEGLRRSLDRIGSLYRDAYDWTPPEIGIGERLAGKSMRQYVKSWIATWDMERLYGEAPQIETVTIPTDYSESSDIEQVPAAAEQDDSEA